MIRRYHAHCEPMRKHSIYDPPNDPQPHDFIMFCKGPTKGVSRGKRPLEESFSHQPQKDQISFVIMVTMTLDSIGS